MFSLLKDRRFRLLWIGQICSQFGDRLIQLILVGLAATRASGSAFTLATVMVFTSLPALVVAPVAGAFVDRWDRKRTMIACDLIRAAGVAAIPWLAWAPSQALLYLDIFLLFAVGSFFLPARLALIPDLVPPDHLGRANALFNTSGMIGSAVIVLVGALLVEWAGVTRSCWVDAAGYLASAAFIAPLTSKKRAQHVAAGADGGATMRPGAAGESARRIASEVWEGLRELWGHRETRRVISLLGCLIAGAGASMVAGAVLVQTHLGSVTKDIGFLSLWFGVGMFLGTVAHGRWGTHRSKRTALGAAFVGCAASLLLFMAAVVWLRSGAGACLAAGTLGTFVAPVGIIANTLVHEAHPERLHGRIFSGLGVVVNLSLILSMLAAGWLVEQGGRGLLLGLIAAGFFAAGLVLLLRRR